MIRIPRWKKDNNNYRFAIRKDRKIEASYSARFTYYCLNVGKVIGAFEEVFRNSWRLSC